VNRLKLNVSQANANQHGERRVGMQEPFQFAQVLRNLLRRRRDECRFMERASAGADPVLTGADFAWREMLAANVPEQFRMNFAN
jgi:hypothetical protein